MEHEFEKIIREKVNTAEQTPVIWEKELVWSKIKLPSIDRSIVFYYAAASFVLAASLFFYGIELTRQKEFDLQLKSIELSIEQNKSYQASLTKNEPINELSACVESSGHNTTEKISPASSGFKKVKKHEQARPVLLTEDNIKTQELSKTIITTLQTEEKSVPVTQEQSASGQSSETVQAIISGGGQNFQSVAGKEKRLRFQLFRPGEDTDLANVPSEPITIHSRINQH